MISEYNINKMFDEKKKKNYKKSFKQKDYTDHQYNICMVGTLPIIFISYTRIVTQNAWYVYVYFTNTRVYHVRINLISGVLNGERKKKIINYNAVFVILLIIILCRYPNIICK